ncbi:MAG: hypothetical protein IIV29_01650, partial [Tidjanibacter sp.]|nr:hypothetical protein [Tidjanibacter sp.]
MQRVIKQVGWNGLRGLLMALCVGVITLALGGCEFSEQDNELESGVAEHTLVMYLNANNNLSPHITNNVYDAEIGMV